MKLFKNVLMELQSYKKVKKIFMNNIQMKYLMNMIMITYL